MATIGERMATIEARADAIELARRDRDREFGEFRAAVLEINASLKLLLADKSSRDGALGLGRWLIGIGLPALIGGWAIALWHFLAEK